MMSTLRYRLARATEFCTCFLLLLPFSTDRAGLFFSKKGGSGAESRALASPVVLTDVRQDGTQTNYGRHRFHRSTLKSVTPHRSGFLSLGENVSSSNESATDSGVATSIHCTIQFEGPISKPPTLTVGPVPHPAGPFLTILRDTHAVANGWIHGYQKGVQPDSTVYFGASSVGEGEYAEVHPPSGEHTYDLIVFDKDYLLGPRLSALTGTSWSNHGRALGSEDAVLGDIRVGNPGSNPQIIGRCSTTVSHEQVASAGEEM